MDLPIIIKFTPEKEDYVHASRTLARKSSSFMILAGVVILIILAAAIVLIIPGLGTDALNNIALVVLLFGSFYVVYYLVFIPFQLSRAFKKNEYLQKEREFTFTESNILMQIGDRSVDLVWEGLHKVIDGRHLYLLSYKVEEQVYPFISKRALENEQTEQALLDLFKAKSIPVN